MKQEKTTLTNDDMKRAEASGQMKPMPVMPEQMPEKPKTDESHGVINDPAALNTAIGMAQMNGEEYLEVSETLFKYLLRNNKSNYLTYGKPGIKIYRAGTRRQMEREDKMSAEDHYNLMSKRRLAAMPAETSEDDE